MLGVNIPTFLFLNAQALRNSTAGPHVAPQLKGKFVFVFLHLLELAAAMWVRYG